MAGGTDQPESRSEKSRIFAAIAIVVFVLILGFIYWQSGSQGLNVVFKKFLQWAAIAIIAGLIIYGVLYLLRRPKVDLVENDRRDIIEAGTLSKPPMVGDLYLTGDKQHGSFRLGAIIGYCQLQSYKDLSVIAGLTQKQIDALQASGKVPSEYILNEDCFVFKRMPFPLSIFEEPKVLRVLEHEHTPLIGDVSVYAVSILKKYGYYYPNRAHLDVARIDMGVIREVWRGQIHQFLKDAVSIQQRAVGLDSEHKKTIDQRKLLKIPSPFGEAEERGQQR
jgi:hypothetical protein